MQFSSAVSAITSQRHTVTDWCILEKKHSVLFMMMSYTVDGCFVSLNNSQERPSCAACTRYLYTCSITFVCKKSAMLIISKSHFKKSSTNLFSVFFLYSLLQCNSLLDTGFRQYACPSFSGDDPTGLNDCLCLGTPNPKGLCTFSLIEGETVC